MLMALVLQLSLPDKLGATSTSTPAQSEEALVPHRPFFRRALFTVELLLTLIFPLLVQNFSNKNIDVPSRVAGHVGAYTPSVNQVN